MRRKVCVWSVAALACALPALIAPAAQGAFGISKWEAGTCTVASCTASTPEEFYTQAAGHPPFGITDVALNKNGAGEPEGHVQEVRVEIPPGLSVDPLATPQCKFSELEGSGCPEDTKVGKVQLTAHVGVEVLGLKPGITISPPLPGSEATVYNMEPPPGVPLEAAFKVSIFETIVRIVGGIDTTGDYHEYFTISEIPENPELIESRLIFEGTALGPDGTLPFITMPSTCLGPQTSYVKVRSYEGQEDSAAFTTPVGASGCSQVPFKPSVGVTPATTQSDEPDGATIKVEVPQYAASEALDSSMVKDATVTLPEGMTLDPSAANGLQACTEAQFGKGSAGAVECPAASRIGTDTIETPDLPAGALTGGVYLGQPLSTDPESGREYRIFIDADDPAAGVSVKLEGGARANASTGQLTTAVLEDPQVPFSDFTVTLNGGPEAPLANPLACGAATTDSSLVPYSGNPAAEPAAAFGVDFDGKGGACPSPLPFALSQTVAATPTTAAGSPSFTYSLARSDGQQYLSKLAVTLPDGLVGRIPAVTLCGEPQAESGECAAASQIGTAAVSAGSGPHPYSLGGTVYLTGPYAGAPYGLSVVVPAEKVGPFDYGKIVTRAGVSVEPFTAQVLVTSRLPTIVGGVPLRLRSLSVNVNRSGFLLNPTDCAPLDVSGALTSTMGDNASLSSPFQASGCSALSFSPKLAVSTTAKTSRARGAALSVKMTMPATTHANVKSVSVTLPKQLVARISTLGKACPQAQFAADPSSACPQSRVGEATLSTPVLPDSLHGRALFVSHGGAAFPDLDVVLSGDGVTVILVGNTYINPKTDLTSSDFASLPDVPFSSFALTLPTGPNSALAANGSLCKQKLAMPTTIVAQNGAQLKRGTQIAVAGCPRRKSRTPRRGHARDHGKSHTKATHRR